MKKSWLCLTLLAGMVLVCARPSFAAQQFAIKLGHTGAPNHHYQEICLQFAQKVKERSNGAIEIAVFPSDQLGRQLESVEGTMIGTHDMVLTSDSVLSNWVPDMNILLLPFVFKDNWDVRKVLDGPVGEKLAKKMEQHGAVVIGWWENGMRNITNNKRPIKKPEDMVGLKIRVPEGEIFVDTFKALGAGPTVISFGELYSALQLGTVDGQENPVAHVVTQKFYEVQKYLAVTNHVHNSSPLVMSKALLERMPENLRNILLDEAKKMGAEHTKVVERLETAQWAEVKAKGMIIEENIDYAPFKAKVQSVIDKAKQKYDAALIDEMIAIVNK